MSYAILRTAKLTSLGNLGGSSQHNFRERRTPNADPGRTPSNVTTGAQSSKDVIEAVKARLATQPKIRKNAVLAVEYFIGASPEFFKTATADQRELYFNAAESWLKNRHGAENVISVTRQYDETSPHICAYVVPIDPQGKLNASHFLDGRTKLSEMQTHFAEKVGARFGLQRGIEGSTAKHQTIKQYYSKIQAQTPEVKAQIPEVPEATVGQQIAEAFGFDTSHSKLVEQQQQAIKKRQAEEQARKKALEAKAKQFDAEQKANRQRAASLAQLRSNSTHARDLPLDSVLQRLGCEIDPKDKHNWRTPQGRLTLTETKFYLHDQGKGGGGAIDLVMALEETDYRGAMQWLTQTFGAGPALEQVVAHQKREVAAAAAAPAPPFKLPEAKPENWPRVREYLTQARGLSASIIDRLHQLKKVYADRYSNAVFVLNNGEGCELRGTGDKPFHGVRGEKLPFMLPSRGERSMAFVESSIDAISLFQLGFKGGICAMAGSSSSLAKELAARYRKEGLEVIAAFDNDKPGEAMSLNLGEPTKRLRPATKDWNQDLLLEQAREKEASKASAQQLLDKLNHLQQERRRDDDYEAPGY